MDIVLIIKALTEAAALAASIHQRASSENRDPTPEEWQQIMEAKAATDTLWESLAPGGSGIGGA